MKVVVSAATLAAVLTGAAAQSSTPTINTPTSLVVCQPAQLQFSGGTAPYFLSVLPGGQTAATPLETLPEQSGTTYTWTVDIAAGTMVTLAIRDSAGLLNYSQVVTIQAGTSTSCLGANSVSAGSSAVAATGTSAASAASSAASSASSSVSMASSSSSAAASSKASTSSAAMSSAMNTVSSAAAMSSSVTAAPSASPSSGGSGKVAAISGAMGLVGAAVVAMFA